MSTTSLKPVLFAAAIASSFFLSGCGSEQQKADAPPKPGTIAHSWYSAGVAWKAGEYEKTMQYLMKVASSKSEYSDRAGAWLIVASGGVADGYLELSNAYDEGAKSSKGVSADFRNQMREVRGLANAAALQFAESVHELLEKSKDPQFRFDFEFPGGNLDEPMQLVKVKKGLQMQGADHETLRKAMAARGVVRFAATIAGSPKDSEKAKTQWAGVPRQAAITGIAANLIATADLYSSKKLDLPKRGNALCGEAVEMIALLPDGKERKALDAKAKGELRKYKVAS